MQRFTGSFAALLAAGVLALGCASNGTAQTDAAEARRIAEEANAKATQAQADAAAARTAADDAARQAREANEKADRIFQRSLQK